MMVQGAHYILGPFGEDSEPAEPLETRLERKHKRAVTAILPEEHRPNRLFAVGSEQSSAALKSTPTTNFRFSDSCE